MIVGHIAKDFDTHVRVGAANAGHTLYTRSAWEHHAGTEVDWMKHVMQQIPCAAYANPSAELIIGPGAIISPEIFVDELFRWNEWAERRRFQIHDVIIDPRAHVITPDQIKREARTDLAERIGSTSATAKEGIGVAQSDRVMRSEKSVLAVDHPWPSGVGFMDVPELLHECDNVLLEGTQGTGLSLTTGTYPYVTSRNTTVAGLSADAGFDPRRLDRVILVARTYPIRVAGKSGPFYPGSKEIKWAGIGVDPKTEKTTVTRKVRRVATFSVDQVREAVILNGATEIALTFCDYMDPRIAGESGSWNSLKTYPEVDRLVGLIEQVTEVPVKYLGTGPRSVINLSR